MAGRVSILEGMNQTQSTYIERIETQTGAIYRLKNFGCEKRNIEAGSICGFYRTLELAERSAEQLERSLRGEFS